MNDRTTSPLFGAVADEFCALHGRGLKTERNRVTWRRNLGPAYCAALRGKPIAAITAADVFKVLEKHWWTKNPTMMRLRSMLEMVFDFALEQQYRTDGINQAARGNFKRSLPPIKRRAQHHPALAVQALPGFVAELRARPCMSTLALQFIMATAVRPYEGLHAQWSEMDLESGVWHIPAGRKKENQPLRVPLSTWAMGILRTLWQTRTSKWVFPGYVTGKPLSITSLYPTVRARGVTIHGTARSSSEISRATLRMRASRPLRDALGTGWAVP